MKQLLTSKNLRQFISYFFVGGISAVVEWTCFYILSLLDLNYLLATCIAFAFSTTTNLILGRKWAFKPDKSFSRRIGEESFLVFLVSGIGLLFNILLMFIFVDLLRLDTPVLKTVSKILSTGIVFVWNYLIRKYYIYRKG